MKRSDLTEKLLDIKREKGWSWKHICEKIGGYSEVLIVGAILGQMKLTKPQAANAADRSVDLPLLRTGDGQRPRLEGADRGGIWRRHHVGDRFRHGDGAPAQSQGRPGQDHDVGQIPALQILRRQRQRAGIWIQGGVRRANLLRHCEPTGRANARPMTGSAKQSTAKKKDWIASSLRSSQ